jgi:hypothetical protein
MRMGTGGICRASVAVLGLGLACAAAARADIVHMKGGGIIPECRILQDDGEKVHLQAKAGWVLASASEVAVTGEVAGTGAGAKRLAFINAINRNAEDIHRLLDQLLVQRAAAVEAAAAPKGPAPKPAASKTKGLTKK